MDSLSINYLKLIAIAGVIFERTVILCLSKLECSDSLGTDLK
jgi:hypothetical protein